MIKAIMACDSQGGIAKNGTLPWDKNPKDLAWFKKQTAGSVVVMGSKTWDDPVMPSPLPGRINVVVTSNPEEHPGADHYISENLLEGIENLANNYNKKDIWIIGGANLFSQATPVISEVYLTIMDDEYNCDTWINIKEIKSIFGNEMASQHDEGMTVMILERFKKDK